jgi:hypothetical protein
LGPGPQKTNLGRGPENHETVPGTSTKRLLT